MKRWLAFLTWLMVFLVLSTGVALAQDTTVDPTQDSLWTMMAPIIAIATMAERVLEIYWGRYEQQDVWPNKAGVPDTKDKDYVFHKQQRSQWLGTVFAFLVVGITNARFFRILGLDILFSGVMLFSVPALGGIFTDFTIGTVIDWFLTAGIIGWGGTELIHNIIEVLVKGRGLWKETQQVRSGEKQLMETQLFYDYIMPQIENMGLKAETFYQITGILRAANIPFEKLASAAAANTMDAFFAELESTAQGAVFSKALHSLMEKEDVSPETLIQVPNMLALFDTDIYQRLMES